MKRKLFRIYERFQVALPENYVRVYESTRSSSMLLEASKEGLLGVMPKMMDEGLRPEIEAIHSDKITRNFTYYPLEKVMGDKKKKSGLYSATYPVPKPILRNHDIDSEPLGRIEEAYMGDPDMKGKCAPMMIVPRIMDQEAIRKILDGRYLTVSIGADTNEARCSICEANIAMDEPCDHMRGYYYNSKGVIVPPEEPRSRMMYRRIGDFYLAEVSFVNVPSDDTARVRHPDLSTVMKEYYKTEEKLSLRLSESYYKENHTMESLDTYLTYLSDQEAASYLWSAVHLEMLEREDYVDASDEVEGTE